MSPIKKYWNILGMCLRLMESEAHFLAECMSHVLDHSPNVSTSSCRILCDLLGSRSPCKGWYHGRRVQLLTWSVILLMYSRNNAGPNTELWWTSDVASTHGECVPLTDTTCSRSERKLFIHQAYFLWCHKNSRPLLWHYLYTSCMLSNQLIQMFYKP